MKTIRKYYTLAIKQNGIWSCAFGDYDKSVVQDEMDDMKESGYYDKCKFKIVCSDDNQESIDKAVSAL